MSRYRAPVVVGLGPGVGAGTVAAALHAHEDEDASGAAPGTAADIAVCSGDEASLQRAEVLRGAPVLMIVLIGDRPPPSRARQRQLHLRHSAVSVLPHVSHWAGLSDTPDEAAVLLAQRPEHLPTVLRAYASGLRLAVTVLIHSGVLLRSHPPLLSWSRATPPPPRPTAVLVSPTTLTSGRGTPLRPNPARTPQNPPGHAAAPAAPHGTPSRPAPLATSRSTPSRPTPLSTSRNAPRKPTPSAPRTPTDLALDDDALETEALTIERRSPLAPEPEPRSAWHRPDVSREAKTGPDGCRPDPPEPATGSVSAMAG